MTEKKTLLDFPCDIYFMHGDQDQLRERLAQEWKKAINDANPAEAIYMLFQLEGYDVPYGDCVKVLRAYRKMEAYPPWGDGPVCY
jgi:hypothetical protein